MFYRSVRAVEARRDKRGREQPDKGRRSTSMEGGDDYARLAATKYFRDFLAAGSATSTSERTITAMQQKKQHLQAYSPTPFGFQRSDPAHEKSGSTGELSRHSHEAEVVQMMERWDAERWTYQGDRGRADEAMRTDKARRKALACLDRSRDPSEQHSPLKSRLVSRAGLQLANVRNLTSDRETAPECLISERGRRCAP